MLNVTRVLGIELLAISLLGCADKAPKEELKIEKAKK
jgi:hypothetical protein